MKTWITDAPIDVAALLEDLGTAADGAIALFIGTVRDHNEGRSVLGIEYDAYRPMAARVLAQIAQEAADRWATNRIIAVHRVGTLAVGEVSVAIGVATPHRGDAFDACRYIIEQIKERLPIWKRERYADGAARWLDGHTVVARTGP